MSTVFAMCLFSLSMSISPGPVNLLTLSTGLNYGCRAAMPFVTGATVGFTLLLGLIGLGLGELAAESGVVLQILSGVGCLFILYLGVKLTLATAVVESKKRDAPNFRQGFLLQWLNPKAWSACLAGVGAFNLSNNNSELTLFVTLYFMICYVSIASWALLGERMQALVISARSIRIFNVSIGSSLILLALYLFTSHMDY